ncbi:MAG: C4-dicarboxylate TRAP transporter substrate-binding protein [Fusobacteriaceae bacterium]|jgi:TRAP-type C4-dicarboxylate transport system substrate-binding protein|nr:C4-dicarboxylate TRAP transporter substrate-binding protein [Fusobacteriaceae bacterium]
MKRFFRLATLLTLFALLVSGLYAAPRVIKLTTKFVPAEQTTLSLVKVIDGINKGSKGALEVQLFDSGTMPIGKDGLELVAQGGDVMCVDGVDFLGDYVPDFNAIIGPFLYTSFDEYLAMVRTPLVEDLKAKAYEQGIKVLSIDWVFGFRSMMLKKPVKVPEDMKGINLRVPTSPLYTETIKALGANPIAMSYPDTYAAIQSGVIDGVEGSIMTYWGTKQWENVKEYSLTNHLLGVSAVTISRKLWESLTPEQQKLIQEQVDLGAKDNLDATVASEADFMEKLKGVGVNVHEVDADAFNKAASVVFTKFPKWTPGIYDKIMVELNKIRGKK